MANLMKPWIARWEDAEGNRVSANTPGATKHKERAKKWYAQNVPGWPKGKRIPLATHKATAQALLNRLVEQAIKGQTGLLDRYAGARRVPLGEHLDDFERRLKAEGKTSPRQVKQVTSRVREIFDGCGWDSWADLTADNAPDQLLTYLAERREKPRAEGGIGAQTSNFYIAAAKQFCWWMEDAGRLPENPFKALHGVNVQVDRRHDRRELAEVELKRLLEATRASADDFRGLAGTDRVMLYTVAMTTGFRVSELAALTTASFDLDGLPPTVTIGATHTKNKRTVTQPLPDDIREPLRAYLAQRPAGATVWPGTWGEKAARMIRRDEAAAGIAYGVTVADGTVRYADFHALRHTYITLLGRSGVSAKEAQALARHSDVNLTLARYTHAALGELGAAVNRLPALSETPRPTVQITVEALAILGLVVKGAILTPGGASAALVAPLVAPRTDAPGDGSGRAGTKGHRRPGQAAKPLALVG